MIFRYVINPLSARTIRILSWLFVRSWYSVSLHGRENVPKEGGVLIVSNHISWLDGVLIKLFARDPRMFADEANFRGPLMRWFTTLSRTILVARGPKSIIKAMQEAQRTLADGGTVGIFPEGGISRTSQVGSFKPGMARMLKDTDAQIVPVYIDGLWGSIFSFSGGRFFKKWPMPPRSPVSISFGSPLPSSTDRNAVRQALMELSTDANQRRSRKHMLTLPRTFLRTCRRWRSRVKVVDSAGMELSGAMLLIRTLILRRLLLRHVLKKDEKNVAVLLPPMVPTVLANLALSLSGRVVTNLNYTATSGLLNDCIKRAGIKHVITSRRFMSRMDFDLNAEIVFLEDLKDKPTTWDKISTAVATYALPSWLHEIFLGLRKIKPDDVLTVIFTSGSEGKPKGVMLTHANLASNVAQVEPLVKLTKEDMLIGIVPFFHTLGYMVTMWGASTLNVRAMYHFNPLDGKVIGSMAEKYGGTIMLSTPTFLRTYLKRCTPEQFAKLDTVVTGAERLPREIADAFEQKFGARPVEGYGTTELSPLVAVNIPPSRQHDQLQVESKEGTVGRPIPGVSAKVVHLETGETLPPGEPGMLMVTGPNVMKGYLDDPEKTAEVIKDGWYVTGDVAVIDEDGFIKITGRESRFSKIGGEMVPHVRVEEEIGRLLQESDESDASGKPADDASTGPQAVVTAIPDERKGEKLIVLHTGLAKSPEEIRQGLLAAGLPNLYLPATDAFLQVEELPVLGSGKIDLKAIRQIALERTASSW